MLQCQRGRRGSYTRSTLGAQLSRRPVSTARAPGAAGRSCSRTALPFLCGGTSDGRHALRTARCGGELSVCPSARLPARRSAEDGSRTAVIPRCARLAVPHRDAGGARGCSALRRPAPLRTERRAPPHRLGPRTGPRRGRCVPSAGRGAAPRCSVPGEAEKASHETRGAAPVAFFRRHPGGVRGAAAL